MATRTKVPQEPETIPLVGMSRWETLRHFIPVSRETWRQLVIAKRAPAPYKLSERCTMYSNADVHRWIADPANYRAEG
jgi:prophage regulatory protein